MGDSTEDRTKPGAAAGALVGRSIEGPIGMDPVNVGAIAGALATRQQTMATAFSGLIPTSIGEAFTLAQTLAKSTAIPKGYRGKPENILVSILAGLEIGLTPIRSLNMLTNISGNLGMRADLAIALVRRSGVLDYYDEGYEEREGTDGDLATRAADGGKILALVKTVPKGAPYGWASGRRKGDPPGQITTRVFSWVDADTAEIWEDDESSGRKRSKLSERFNYKSFPGDIYPKRARTRVLGVLFSDVLAGMPTVESLEGGQVIDAEFRTVAPDADAVLAAIEETDPTLAANIVAGFDALKMSPARRLQKLTEFQDHPDRLATWLRDEFGTQTGRGPVGTERNAKAGAAVLEKTAKVSEKGVDPPAGDAPKPAESATTAPVDAKPPAPGATSGPSDATPAAVGAPSAGADAKPGQITTEAFVAALGEEPAQSRRGGPPTSVRDIAETMRRRFQPGQTF